MEEVFGPKLVQFKETEEAFANGNYCTETPTEEVLGANVKYIGVLFTANYCPPCHAIIEPLKNFYNEFKSSGFELVTVNCDRNE